MTTDQADTSTANTTTNGSTVLPNLTDAQLETANKQLALEERKQAFEEHKQIIAFQSEQRRLAIADAIHTTKVGSRPIGGQLLDGFIF